ncbi:pentapeptide repeat-containing protein [Lentzea sp. NPDC005914]|uniref:pentapeptide repeat-containing protein n=1 Tax=Lentzea sp. NPDC005914 TaxID=3154572 RepID=UPI0033EAB6A3
MRWAWLAAVLAALVVTAGTGVALYLVHAPAVEIVKTAGVAGGAVVALYALWLNDRRRKVEEARHSLESEKVADERFARSVELLGNEADQVRVGAMHALAWLARSTPRYRQTVLDVLCAYLRRPFDHPAYKVQADDPNRADSEVAQEIRLEHQVRLTAQRLIKDTLSWGDHDDDVHYDLDLTDASLEYFSLDGRRINWLTARRAQFYGITRFRKVHVLKPALFSGARFLGRLELNEARFEGGISFQEAVLAHEVELSGASVGRFFHASDHPPAHQIGELNVQPNTEFRIPAPGWQLTGSTETAGLGLRDHVEQDARGGADGVPGDGDGLGNGKVPAKADEAGAVGLHGE